MHELSIALSILEIAAEEAERRGGLVVRAIHLKLGPLSGVVRESLLSAYDLAREGSSLETARLVVEEVPILLCCPTCDAKRPVPSIQHLRCSHCGAAGEVVQGRELEIAALEVDDP